MWFVKKNAAKRIESQLRAQLSLTLKTTMLPNAIAIDACNDKNNDANNEMKSVLPSKCALWRETKKRMAYQLWSYHFARKLTKFEIKRFEIIFFVNGILLACIQLETIWLHQNWATTMVILIMGMLAVCAYRNKKLYFMNVHDWTNWLWLRNTQNTRSLIFPIQFIRNHINTVRKTDCVKTAGLISPRLW